MQPNLNELLLSQIRQTFGGQTELPPNLAALLHVISDSYTDFQTKLKQVQETASLRTEQLIASTSRAYSFLDSIHKGFIMFDTSGEVVLTNNAVRDILFLNTPASQEQPISTDVLHSLLQQSMDLKALVKESLASSQIIEKDEVNFGKRVLRLYIAPINSTGGTQALGVVMLVEDITEQKDLERSKDEFLSIASHELRTPLTAIRGNASLINKYYADSIKDKDMQEMIDDIHESSIRLIGIVNDFLDVAAMEQGKIRMNVENFQLQSIVAEVVHELEHLCADKNVTLQADQSVTTTAEVKGDKQRVKQVLINLVGNALKYTDEGGITISTRSDGQFVQVLVADTGRGMDAEAQQFLFKKFQQTGSNPLTKDTTKGTGLGLYISKLIIELLGGKIGLVTSAPDKGSTFAFTLPLTEPTA